MSPGPAGLGRQVGTQPRTRGVCRPLHAPTLVREGGAQAEGRWGRTPGLGRGQLATHAAESVTVGSHTGQQMFSVRKKGRQSPAGGGLLGKPTLQRAAEPANHRPPCSTPGAPLAEPGAPGAGGQSQSLGGDTEPSPRPTSSLTHTSRGRRRQTRRGRENAHNAHCQTHTRTHRPRPGSSSGRLQE